MTANIFKSINYQQVIYIKKKINVCHVCIQTLSNVYALKIYGVGYIIFSAVFPIPRPSMSLTHSLTHIHTHYLPQTHNDIYSTWFTLY